MFEESSLWLEWASSSWLPSPILTSLDFQNCQMWQTWTLPFLHEALVAFSGTKELLRAQTVVVFRVSSRHLHWLAVAMGKPLCVSATALTLACGVFKHLLVSLGFFDPPGTPCPPCAFFFTDAIMQLLCPS